MNRSTVAQISNLLYRRIPFGWASANFKHDRTSLRLRIGNPRYSRLEICATGRTWSVCSGSRIQCANRIGEFSPLPSPQRRGRIARRLSRRPATGFAGRASEKLSAHVCRSLSQRERVRVRESRRSALCLPIVESVFKVGFRFHRDASPSPRPSPAGRGRIVRRLSRKPATRFAGLSR